MHLETMTPTALRLLFAACCGAPDSPMSEEQRTSFLRRALDHSWYPTPTDTPVAFGLVEAWYGDMQQRAKLATSLTACADGLDTFRHTRRD